MDIQDKNVIITGGNSGIGFYTALDLAKRGAVVTILGRDEETCKSSVEMIKTETRNQNVLYKIVDLASFRSIKRFAEYYMSLGSKLDILINNAGIHGPPVPETEQGIEATIGVNYLGHFYLVQLLTDLLVSSGGRLVVVASEAYRHAKITVESLEGDSPELFAPVTSAGFQEYSVSNVARVMFTQEFAKRYPSVRCVSLHPGFVKTNITRSTSKFVRCIFSLFARTPENGARNSIYCATEEVTEEENGGYFVDCKHVELLDHVKDSKLQEMLWDVSVNAIEKFNM